MVADENADVQTVLQRRQALKNRVLGKVPDSNEVGLALPAPAEPNAIAKPPAKSPRKSNLPKTKFQKMLRQSLDVAPVEIEPAQSVEGRSKRGRPFANGVQNRKYNYTKFGKVWEVDKTHKEQDSGLSSNSSNCEDDVSLSPGRSFLVTRTRATIRP